MLPMNGPDLFADEMRFTRLSAGRKIHWSSGSRILVCDRSDVPATSRGASNVITLLSPAPASSLSRARLRS